MIARQRNSVWFGWQGRRPLFIFLTILLISPSLCAEVLMLGGTGALYPVMTQLGDRFKKAHPGIEFELLAPPLGSSGGIRALAKKKIDVALSGRQPTAEELREGDLLSVPLGQSPLIFVSNEVKTARTSNFDLIANLYAGRLDKWSDGTPVRVVLRPPADTEMIAVRQLSSDIDQAVAVALARPGMVTAMTDADNSEIIMRTRGAFGAMTLGQYLGEARSFTVLPIDGVRPSVKSLADGSYRPARGFYLVYRKTAGALVNDFIGYMKSPAAQAQLRETGFLPAP